MNLEKQLGTILKQIIDQESLNYLKTNPFGVYQNLIDKDVAEHSARLILMTLLAKIPEKLERNNWDLETLIQYIQMCIRDRSGFRDNQVVVRRIKKALFEILGDDSEVERIYKIIEKQEEY